MAGIVHVGCKLPHGLRINVGKKEVVLNGINKAAIAGGHGLTEVDADFWKEWLESPQGKTCKAITSGAIFHHQQAQSIASRARELAKERTGFEGMNPEKPGGGVEKLDKE